MEYNLPLGYCLTRNVKDPAYGTGEAGCIDFFVPEFDEQFLIDLKTKNPGLASHDIALILQRNSISLSPGEAICIPSGVHARLEPHTALTAFNKSGVATKMRLIRGAEYVDSDYQGEIHLHLINAGEERVHIEAGQKIIQFSYVPVFRANMTKFETKEKMYDGFSSERGENWQGSTGTK